MFGEMERMEDAECMKKFYQNSPAETRKTSK